jgi:CPA2 family monovalent cation:H+ antiporter-2
MATTALLGEAAHSFEHRAFLQDKGASEAVIGELELALELERRASECFEIEGEAVERSIEDTRRSVST